ncbi:MAG: hypothetical protein ACRBFS_13935 [Aureispira sp.]
MNKLKNASSSNLSNDKYGYDLVIATTQNSINSTAKHYLSKLEKKSVSVGRFKVTYFENDKENSKLVTYEELKKQFTDGHELFNIPNGDKSSEIFNILEKNNVDEISGFTAKLGLPKKNWNKKKDNIIELLDYKQVKYKLTCYEFNILSYKTTRHGFEWGNVAQGDSKHKKPWIFVVKVPLKDIAHKEGHLPDPVKNQTSTLTPGTFSVQKLILDLDKCFLHESPTIEGLDKESDEYTFLMEHFINGYIEGLKKNGGAILDYKINHFKKPEKSSLFITDINMNSKLNEADSGISTLCYLGTTDGKKPKSLSDFDWYWVDDKTTKGVMAVNRLQFAKILAKEILPVVQDCCFSVGAKVKNHHTSGADYTISATWPHSPDSIEYLSTGNTIVKMCWSSEADAKDDGWVSENRLKIECNFDVHIKFEGKQITVVRHLKFFIKLDNSDKKKGYPVDTTITDVYDLSINGEGMIILQKHSSNKDEQGKPLPSHWWSGLNNVTDSFSKWIKNLADSELHNINLDSLGNFYFPGGNVFAFKNPRFSDHQDLLAEISYSNPIVD